MDFVEIQTISIGTRMELKLHNLTVLKNRSYKVNEAIMGNQKLKGKEPGYKLM